MTDTTQARNNRLIHIEDSLGSSNLPDWLALLAYNIEEAMILCGGEPGKDYSRAWIMEQAISYTAAQRTRTGASFFKEMVRPSATNQKEGA